MRTLIFSPVSRNEAGDVEIFYNVFFHSNDRSLLLIQTLTLPSPDFCVSNQEMTHNYVGCFYEMYRKCQPSMIG